MSTTPLSARSCVPTLRPPTAGRTWTATNSTRPTGLDAHRKRPGQRLGSTRHHRGRQHLLRRGRCLAPRRIQLAKRQRRRVATVVPTKPTRARSHTASGVGDRRTSNDLTWAATTLRIDRRRCTQSTDHRGEPAPSPCPARRSCHATAHRPRTGRGPPHGRPSRADAPVRALGDHRDELRHRSPPRQGRQHQEIGARGRSRRPESDGGSGLRGHRRHRHPAATPPTEPPVEMTRGRTGSHDGRARPRL